MFCYCSDMPKPRRKHEIRQSSQREVEELKLQRGCILSNDWRGKVLDAVLNGKSFTTAARMAGVKRARIYSECYSNPSFDRALNLAKHYRHNRIQYVSRPIWPPTPETLQRHEATLQRIEDARRYELVGTRI
jgi:hypothetical protein